VPSRGLHYPGSYAELRAWFPDDDACMDYLDWLRWPNGVGCPACGWTAVTAASGRVWRCGGCRKRVSRTAGTILQNTRTPLTVWFAAGWYMTADPGGVSALRMQRLLGLGSYQRAWAMLHRYRTAMVRPGREVLIGRVEVDETFVGGERPGPRGRGAQGKTLVVVAVELREPQGYGRARMNVIPNANAKTLRSFLIATVEPGATVVTDGWSAYPKACEDWFTHEPYPVARSGHQAHELLPAVHRVSSLCKRWLMGTHQGGVQPEHLQAYLEELCFRFNRRHARARGLLFYRLLQYAAGAAPVTYRKMVATSRPQGRQTGRGQGPTFQAGHPRAAARGPTLARCSQLGVVSNRQTCAPGSETDSPLKKMAEASRVPKAALPISGRLRSPTGIT